MEITLELKSALHQWCITFITNRLILEQRGLQEAQETANSDTKSSAGDKYETGRAMAHLEAEKFSRMITETSEILDRISQISPTQFCETVVPGAVVSTNHGCFYCLISADDIEIDGEEFCTISLASPLGTVLAGKSSGDSFEFRGSTYTIVNVG